MDFNKREITVRAYQSGTVEVPAKDYYAGKITVATIKDYL